VLRAFAPLVDGQSAFFANVNRGKESIALDVEAHPDRELFRELVRHADVVVENFSTRGSSWRRSRVSAVPGPTAGKAPTIR
jgi:crotonobetainyl-CoA:carnitine CoA-transferase CaiB-like acyl-CoA transferase